MKRRTLIKSAGLTLAGMTALGGITTQTLAKQQPSGQADPAPLENELDKYPRCVVCNMDRKQFHFSRHLVYLADKHAQGTCSINCASEVMLRERKRGFLAVYAADYGQDGAPKPLTEASAATYLIGSSLRAVMAPVSKYAFARGADAEAEMSRSGGQLASFDQALAASLEDYAKMLSQSYTKTRES